MKTDLLVVGAGLAGCTVAERVASELGWDVLVIDRRDTVGGNVADGVDAAGIMVQKHGPHIFHTRLLEVWHYLNRFGRFNDYQHRVLARVNGLEVCLPLNLESAEALFHRSFTADSWRAFLDDRRLPLAEIRNSRDVALSQVGEELYEWIFRGYTRKQWGVEPEELDPEVLKRIPLRFDRDTRYFTDPYQGIPVSGFTALASAMLESPRIRVQLLADFCELRSSLQRRLTVFTGPIDEYFDFRLGRLPYRSLRFEWQTLDQEYVQRAAVVNYPQENEFTRITEYKHFHLQHHPRTTISREYPTDAGEPYYPIPRPANRSLYAAYADCARQEKDVFFVGRLAQYRYLNMDEAVAAGLELASGIIERYRI
jgi:UDP-galactopyranose mutase